MNLLFDIGFNLGGFSKPFIENDSNLKVIAVEANPQFFNYYGTYPNITFLNYALSDKDNQELDFYISDSHTISTIEKRWINEGRFINYKWKSPIKVKTITLDNLIQKYGIPNLIKIDIEGYEHIAIKGLTQKAKYICFEWTEEFFNDHVSIIINHLKSIGYDQFNYIIGDNYKDFNGTYKSWEDLNMKAIIDPPKKDKWGMIFCK
jgi:FkbM family methyltransferase